MPNCLICIHNKKCPVYWHKGNAACITIFKELEPITDRKPFDSIPKNCFSCLNSNECTLNLNENCKNWKLGKCYTCKHLDNSKNNPDTWNKMDCESNCNHGCEQYEQDFKKTLEMLILR